jgi:uncharacterized protein (UPF0548 family)
VIRLRRPSAEEIDALVSRPDAPFNYPEVGATADVDAHASLAVDYTVDRNRFTLGTGRDLFEQARTQLFAWRHFDIPWLAIQRASVPAFTGQVVATLTRFVAIWFLNPCRVVYTEGASGPSNVAAFAYGTLPGHIAFGEERFQVHFDPLTQKVSYEILAFSRPAILLSKIGRPWVRRIQRRFVVSSAEALARACRRTSSSRSAARLSADPPGGTS